MSRLDEIKAHVEEWNSTKLVREDVPWLLGEVERLTAEAERWRTKLDEANDARIAAQNPGIDMDDVRRIRAEAAAVASTRDGHVHVAGRAWRRVFPCTIAGCKARMVNGHWIEVTPDEIRRQSKA